MAKTDLILKKAELFERVAVYGRRQDFLRAVAQTSEYYEDFSKMEKDVNKNIETAMSIIHPIFPALNFDTPEYTLKSIEKAIRMYDFPNEDMSALLSVRSSIANFIAQKDRYQQGFNQQFGDIEDTLEDIPTAKSHSNPITSTLNFYARQVQTGIQSKNKNLLKYYLKKLYDLAIKAVNNNIINSSQQQQYLNLFDQGKYVLKELEANLAASELDKLNPYEL